MKKIFFGLVSIGVLGAGVFFLNNQKVENRNLDTQCFLDNKGHKIFIKRFDLKTPKKNFKVFAGVDEDINKFFFYGREKDGILRGYGNYDFENKGNELYQRVYKIQNGNFYLDSHLEEKYQTRQINSIKVYEARLNDLNFDYKMKKCE